MKDFFLRKAIDCWPPDNAKSGKLSISQVTVRLGECLSLKDAGLKGVVVGDIQENTESGNTAMGQCYLIAGLETVNFPQSFLRRQVWKHDGAGEEKDAYGPLLFLSITLHIIYFWMNK